MSLASQSGIGFAQSYGESIGRSFKNMKPKLLFNGFELRHLLLITCAIFISANSAPAAELPLNDIRLPPGFEVRIYAGNVPNTRSLALSPKGTLFVGTR